MSIEDDPRTGSADNRETIWWRDFTLQQAIACRIRRSM